MLMLRSLLGPMSQDSVHKPHLFEENGELNGLEPSLHPSVGLPAHRPTAMPGWLTSEFVTWL